MTTKLRWFEKIARNNKNNESNGVTDCNWRTWNGSQRFGKGLEDLEIGGRIETIEITAF